MDKRVLKDESFPSTIEHQPLYRGQPGFTLQSVPEKVRDLLTSEVKLRVFEVIMYWSGDFTTLDVSNKLHESGIDVSFNVVQSLLRSLWMRKYLAQYSRKLGTSRGRTTIHYSKQKLS